MREGREIIRESVKIIRRDTLDVGGNVRPPWLVVPRSPSESCLSRRKVVKIVAIRELTGGDATTAG
jgi:hypothetical protein